MKPYSLALLCLPLLSACGDDASPAGDPPTEQASRASGLYEECEVDAECRPGQFCAIGFCTAQCVVPSGVGERDCGATSTCGSGCCLVFDADEGDGACIPCSGYFDNQGNVAGCDGSPQAPRPRGDEGDACRTSDECSDSLRCINGNCSDGCTSDAQCLLSQICSHNECKDVECKYDSDCGSCSRCSDNTCRDCGYGPYGCYC